MGWFQSASGLLLWVLMWRSITILPKLKLATCLGTQEGVLLLAMELTLPPTATTEGQAAPPAPVVTLTAGMLTLMSSLVLWLVVLVSQMTTMRTEEMTLPMRLLWTIMLASNFLLLVF